jgi:hypothetical protein
VGERERDWFFQLPGSSSSFLVLARIPFVVEISPFIYLLDVNEGLENFCFQKEGI